ncbi:iron ABC transporter permease (plasmid) [Pedobacter sp. BS3]|uniref:FecCD family ABC transporter permease n=1 Tax=Pedobacter sp. BS3 TaxID=2567937 RepID=UPI0011EF7B5A|nr:iron ABC transporter permease [Pedobacter sp. BS3]TZF85957.1 iron ABC transporter permease [Pedobacter sp. BS3]
MQRNFGLILIGLALLLLAVIVVSACVGAVSITFNEFWAILLHQFGVSSTNHFDPQQEAVLLALRIPRVLLGVLIGAGLAISGASLQGLFRNPLAEPGLIGISSGASLFAVLMIVLGASLFHNLQAQFGYYALSVAAFTGACLTTFLVYRISVHRGKSNITALLLAGIAINALAFAFVGLMTYLATDEQLRNITFWNLGSLGGASWESVLTLLPFVGIPLIVLPFMAKSLNAFALGETQASHMGIRINRVKSAVIILSTMAVGASVAVSGTIGFIGLIIPHIIRMLFSADHRLVIPASALLGAAVLTLADLLARTIVAPAELPIGIITALVGAPVFIYIIITYHRKKLF